ncbi:MAG: potassium transporter Kup [Phaeodactylibacter sp.]|nr:potassium transporter Kup [Phaeodactylibacter sp.]MCB9054143.1 potassium transporter Kup [Lewinellaceae bacterium]
MPDSNHPKRKGKYFYFLALSAVGVVYGDIGTSPLYAFRECFNGEHALPISHENILGVLSLVFWSLILIISIKYLIIILRANNHGEGGILALMEVVLPKKKSSRRYAVILGMGFFGAALLYGDGIITPAISVLSAVEGLKVATPFFEPYIIPLTIGILFGLFLFQKRGTSGVGRIFGPVMVVWFLTIAILGAWSAVENPEVLQALNPFHAFALFQSVGWRVLYVLGAVFLVVTGGEALYADLGHFGPKPIRLSWFSLVLPCLLLNYFGQGALLLRNAEVAANPFYYLCPVWMLYPMVILATAATVIASQAVISGAFSLTFQAVQLDYLPRLSIEHTSEREAGQVYLPLLNWILFFATALLVLSFKTSSALAAAYGVAVSTTMVITDLLLFIAMRSKWKWFFLAAAGLSAFFLLVDLSFLTANFLKILRGGWLPLLIAGFIYLLMATWQRGRKLVRRKIGEISIPVDNFVASLKEKDFQRVKGTAIYLSGNAGYLPPSLEHNIEHNKVLHEKIIILKIDIKNIPYLRKKKFWSLKKLGHNFYQATASYGYLQKVNVQRLMSILQDQEKELELDLNDLTYFLGRETLVPKKNIGMNNWQSRVFAFMSANAQDATKYFHLPVTKVFEVGRQVNL